MYFAHFRVLWKGPETIFLRKVYAICSLSGPLKNFRVLFGGHPKGFLGATMVPFAIFGSAYRLGFKILNCDPKIQSARQPRRG